MGKGNKMKNILKGLLGLGVVLSLTGCVGENIEGEYKVSYYGNKYSGHNFNKIGYEKLEETIVIEGKKITSKKYFNNGTIECGELYFTEDKKHIVCKNWEKVKKENIGAIITSLNRQDNKNKIVYTIEK